MINHLKSIKNEAKRSDVNENRVINEPKKLVNHAERLDHQYQEMNFV
ncbi:hypothetical protein [Chryseobacterium takakiae]|nr:hypothetical protein [Chryseobacterium takakiae]